MFESLCILDIFIKVYVAIVSSFYIDILWINVLNVCFIENIVLLFVIADFNFVNTFKACIVF